MHEKKYRIVQDTKIIRRNKINEYLRELLKEQQCLFVQGVAGSGKTFTLFSLVQDFYKNRYIYYHIDKDDNRFDTFITHFKEAFQYASLSVFIHNNRFTIETLDKPYILILDQYEHITQTQIIEFVKELIDYRPNNLHIVITSRLCIPEYLYPSMLYNKMTLLENCSFFFERNELIKLQKTYGKKSFDPYEIYSLTLGWPILVNYSLHHHLTDKENPIITNFFNQLELTDEMIKILQIISLTPYTSLDLLHTFPFKELSKSLYYLYNISLIYHEDGQLLTIPILKKYYQRQYHDLLKDILNMCLPYYKEKNYIIDLLYCYYYVDISSVYPYIKNNVYFIEGLCSIYEIRSLIEQYKDKDDKEILYLNGVLSYYQSDIEQYNNILEQLKQRKETELYINLIYLNNKRPLNEILSLKNKDIHLYSLTAQKATVIKGKRDLSNLYILKYIDKKQYKSIKNQLDNNELIYFELGEIEYLLTIGYKQKVLEKIEYFLSIRKDELPFDIIMTLGTIYFKLYYYLGLKDNALTFYHEYCDSIHGRRNEVKLSKYLKEFDVYCACLLHNNDKVYNWYRENKIIEDVNEDNYNHLYIQARYYYMIEKYEQANYYFTKLEAYCREKNYILDLCEMLFANASSLFALGNQDRALHRVVESFMIAGTYRFVFPFVSYDQNGLDVLNMYYHFMIDENDNNKKYSNSIVNKSYKTYLEGIIRDCKRLIKVYPNIKKSDHDLTVKEIAVLKCIMKGYTNKDISEELVISISTVKTHISNIYSKLGVKSRSQVIKYVKDNQLFENND